MLWKPTDARLVFSADNGNGDGGGVGNGNGDNGASDGNDLDKPKSPEFTAEQQAEMDRRIRAARHQAASETKAKLEQTAAEKADAEKAERERKEAEARGEFDTVKASLETEARTHKERADIAEQQIAAYQAVIGPVIEERLKAVTEADEETAKVFPKDADPLAQLDWLNSPLVRRVVDLAGHASTETRSFPMTPKPTGNTPPSIEQTRRELAALRHHRLRS